MVEIDLVRGRPALKVEFRTSLAADLLHVIGLVTSSPSVEGLDQWVYATHAALPLTLKVDLEDVLVLTQKSGVLTQWINKLPPDAPAHRDFASFIAWLNGFGEGDFKALIEAALKYLHCCLDEGQDLSFSLDNTEQLKAALGEMYEGEKLDRLIQLVRNPSELKARLISVITRFWEQFYRQEYQRCLPLMERSAAHHQRQNYGADLYSVFTAVTGRRFPDKYADYVDVERVVFVPCCHLGPWVIINHAKEPQPTVILHYNCRTTAASEVYEMPAVQDLFPPIKALADETRLQILSLLDGRELYAQEIVAQLDISQSAVSRHLKLMVTGGLLTVRKEDSMKYFSIDEEALGILADKLKSFRSKR